MKSLHTAEAMSSFVLTLYCTPFAEVLLVAQQAAAAQLYSLTTFVMSHSLPVCLSQVFCSSLCAKSKKYIKLCLLKAAYCELGMLNQALLNIALVQSLNN